MRHKIVLLIISLIINIVMIVIIILQYHNLEEVKIINEVNYIRSKIDYNVTSNQNFDSIFYNKNDSLYKVLWNYAMGNTPEEAFIISCAYYYVTKKREILNDIDMSNTQLKYIYYNKVPIVNVSNDK